MSKKNILIISFIVPIISIFIDNYNLVNNYGYSLGIPYDFFFFWGKIIPDNRLKMFLPPNLIKIEFRIINYLLCVFIFYIILINVLKFINYLKIKMLEKRAE